MPFASALPSLVFAVRPTAEDLDTLEQKALVDAVDRVAPSVVRIETIGGLERVDRVLFGAGPTTGLVVDSSGYIVSSAFNFVNKPASILVRLPDGTRKPAKLVARDHNCQLVLLKIEPDHPLPVPEVAPQSEMRVGQWCVAVGRTFEESRPNMAVGILSAVGRVWGKALQTDAPVSPNNYGGPLVDIRGRVMGLLVPLSPQSAEEIAGVEWYDSGIGFAVPLEAIQKVLPKLRKGEDLYSGVAGVFMQSKNLYTGDTVIASCRPNSPAAKAQFKGGDRIVEIGGRKVARSAEVKQEISRHYAGDKVHFVVLRGDKRIEADLELTSKLEPFQHGFLGILPLAQRRRGGRHRALRLSRQPGGRGQDRTRRRDCFRGRRRGGRSRRTADRDFRFRARHEPGPGGPPQRSDAEGESQDGRVAQRPAAADPSACAIEQYATGPKRRT